MPIGTTLPYLCLLRRNFCVARDDLLWLQRCDFRTAKKHFPLTTAAQNIHVFLRKSPLCRSHFFEWLKTAISSTACGRVTLKSPPSRGSDAPHVHLRLRKRLSRCTLDCGFQTPESPALRGFEAERCPITGTSLYLVLKSNGPHRSKNLPVKFGFTLKTVSANIAKKLPSQRCPNRFSSHFLTFRTNGPSLPSLPKAGTHSAFGERSHTRAHTAKHGAFRMGVVSLLSERSACSPTSPGRVSERQTLPLWGLGQGYSRRTQKAFGTAMRLCVSLFRGIAAPLGCATLLVYRGIYICERSCRVLPIFQSNYQRCR